MTAAYVGELIITGRPARTHDDQEPWTIKQLLRRYYGECEKRNGK